MITVIILINIQNTSFVAYFSAVNYAFLTILGLVFMNQLNDKNILDTALTKSIQPVFYTGFNDSHVFLNYISYERAQNYFEYRLKQNPENLLCHLQRIQLTLVEKNKDALFAALGDLFIILGQFGLSLRKRLLSHTKTLLSKVQIELLDNSLKNSDLTELAEFLPEGSLFKKESLVLIKMCSAQVTEIEQIENVLETIDSYIENGQFDEALDTMTKRLEQDPENEQLTLELIKLYKTLDDDAGFETAYEKFADHLMTSQYWDDAKQYFLDQN